MSMGSDVRMLRIRESTRRIVHRTYHVTREWQCGIVSSCTLSESGHIVVPLSTIHTLCGKQIGISALPTTWNGSTMEIHQQMVTGSTFEQVDAVIHIHLVVSREKVNLHTSHTNLLTPRKLLLTVFRFVQAIFRTRSTIHPSYRRVVPNQWLHPFRLGIIDSIHHRLAIFHLIPLRINQHVWKVQSCRKIHIHLDDVIIVGAMIICPIHPRHNTRLNPAGISQFARFRHIRDQCRLHHICQRANHGNTPRSVPVTIKSHLVLIGANTIVFPLAIIVE